MSRMDSIGTQVGQGQTVAPVSLSAEDIVVTYGGVHAVDGVTLRAEAGMVTGLIGPNGAGKSSLIGVFAGAQRASRGRILLGDSDITKLPPHLRAQRGLARTFQTTRVFSRLSVLENVIAGERHAKPGGLSSAIFERRGWRHREDASSERALAMLAEFGMIHQADVPCGDLSGGQRRIVEYLRVLMANPRAILLDEPTVGMAPWLLARLATDLDRLCSQGVCVLLVGHEMSFIRQVCDVVIVMANGKVIASGDFDEIAKDEIVQQAYLGRRIVKTP